ncbi:MAG: PEP-CTERM sorting domain-containing protein [Caldilineales bacterium]|nr:PEP-CTERM sorting domain-containing protein [Caldilineales bacterium]
MSTKRLILVTLVLLLLAAIGSTVAAQGATKQVGVVIRFDNGSVHSEIVTVPTDATTADVLEAALIPVGLFDLGFGPAVCNIDSQGCPTDDCFCDAEHFWAYYHQINQNAWESATVGVGDYTPANRSVEGFAWSGFDSSFNPIVQPPVLTFDEIAQGGTPPPAEIPEPATILLLGGGLAGLAAYARKRQNRS